MNSLHLLQRFLRYVQVDTTAVPDAGRYPSSAGQLELGRMVLAELREMGLVDASQDEFGLVMATVPATTSKRVPVVAFNSHFDTSPETTGKNVKPQVIRDYAGGDIPLARDSSKVIRISENPELAELLGRTLITTDGTTLLGADDKAGIAVIMEMAQHLVEHPQLVHGPVRVLFTCDEEIGHGIDHVDLSKVAATVCYTLDGGGSGDIDVETFSADLATVKIRGINIHPSIGKGRMVNAIRAAAAFVDRLPRDGLSPETTDGRQGFLHPYHVVEGSVAETALKVLLRDFDAANLKTQADLLRKTAASVEADYPGASVSVEILPQYRNMDEGLAREPRAVQFAQRAHERLGRTAKLTNIRGGTDGSQFTAKGLPTPNLSTGQHNPHSPLEWACLEEMVEAVEVLVELVQVWGAEA